MGRRKVEDVEEKNPSGMNDLITHLQKTSGAHVTKLSENQSVITVPKFLSTGLPSIDCMLGGGIPAGRITELFSKGEGLGKSSLAAMLMAEMQRVGGTVVLMDTEHGFTTERLQTFGVDPERVIYVEPLHIENVAEVIHKILELHAKDPTQYDKLLVVWDSVTGTPSKQEVDADYDQMQVASSARSLSAVIKKLKDEIARSEVYVVCITQTRQNIGGSPFAEKHQSTGGLGLKYYAGQRMCLYKGIGSTIKDGPRKTGMKVSMMTEKSRMAAPYQTAEAILDYARGYDRWKSLFDLMLKLDIVQQSGGYYSMTGHTGSFRQADFETVLGGLSDEAKESIITHLKENCLTDAALDYFFG